MDSSIPSCLESPGYSETTLIKIVNKINLSVFTKHIHILNEEITYAHMEIALTTSLPQAGCLTLDQEEFRGKKKFPGDKKSHLPSRGVSVPSFVPLTRTESSLLCIPGNIP